MLQADGCISIGENDEIESLTMGRICSFYYLKHQTMGLFATTLKPEMDFKQVHPFAQARQQSCLFHVPANVISVACAGCANHSVQATRCGGL